MSSRHNLRHKLREMLNVEDRIKEIESTLERYYDSEDIFEQTDLAITLIQGHMEWLLHQVKNK